MKKMRQIFCTWIFVTVSSILFFSGCGTSPTSTSQTNPAQQLVDTNLTRWINQLSSTNYPDISIACSKILAVGSNAVPALVNALEHQKGRIRSWSIHLLDQLQATNACPALYKTYHDADSTEKDRPYIVLLLGEFGGDTYSDFFKREFESTKEPDVRLALAITLGKRGDKSAGAYLLNRLESAEEHNRRSQGLLLKQVYKKDFGTDAQQWRAWLQANGKL